MVLCYPKTFEERSCGSSDLTSPARRKNAVSGELTEWEFLLISRDQHVRDPPPRIRLSLLRLLEVGVFELALVQGNLRRKERAALP